MFIWFFFFTLSLVISSYLCFQNCETFSISQVDQITLETSFKINFRVVLKQRALAVNWLSGQSQQQGSCLCHACSLPTVHSSRAGMLWAEDRLNAWVGNSGNIILTIDNLCCKVYVIKCNLCPLNGVIITCSSVNIYLISNYITLYKASCLTPTGMRNKSPFLKVQTIWLGGKQLENQQSNWAENEKISTARVVVF